MELVHVVPHQINVQPEHIVQHDQATVVHVIEQYRQINVAVHDDELQYIVHHENIYQRIVNHVVIV